MLSPVLRLHSTVHHTPHTEEFLLSPCIFPWFLASLSLAVGFLMELCSYADCTLTLTSLYITESVNIFSLSVPASLENCSSEAPYQDDQPSLQVLCPSGEDVPSEPGHRGEPSQELSASLPLLPGHLRGPATHHRHQEHRAGRGEHCGAEGGDGDSHSSLSAPSSSLQEVGNAANCEASQCRHQHSGIFPNLRGFFYCDIIHFLTDNTTVDP